MATGTRKVGMALSHGGFSFADRAAFIRFAKRATIGHWAEVIDVMESELVRQGRDPKTGEPASPATSQTAGKGER